MNLRFIIAFVVTVIVASTITVLATPKDPEIPPHTTRLTDAARGPGAGAATGRQVPGSDLQGLRMVGDYMDAARVQAAVRAEAAARVLAVEVFEPTRPTDARLTSEVPSTASNSWDDQAECETGGDWSMQGSSYSGGLGFANGSWDAYGGQEFAPNAGQATREQQIIVAERIQDEPPSYPGHCEAW